MIQPRPNTARFKNGPKSGAMSERRLRDWFFKRTFDGMKSESMLMTVTIIIKKSKAYLRI